MCIFLKSTAAIYITNPDYLVDYAYLCIVGKSGLDSKSRLKDIRVEVLLKRKN